LLLRGRLDRVSVFTIIWSCGGSTVRCWRRAWCRSGREIALKTDSHEARKFARLLAGGLFEPTHVATPDLEAARTSGKPSPILR
jgi:hypothetical protein